MAISNVKIWKLVQSIEEQIQAAVKEKELAWRNLDLLFIEYRAKCETVISNDFDFALKKSVENRLWDAHLKLNNRFRKLLSSFREPEGKRKAVEQRKISKNYLDFIKSSQRFYRGYIHKLALRFDGIQELEAVAKKFNIDAASHDGQRQCSKGFDDAVLRSCHQTLIRLGDLSRYRETELTIKDHNWGPAIGYYDLAAAIFPASGTSHNQLAVIAQVDANHLRATYHLYRALAAQEPPPTAKGNLELEFKKIHTAWDKGELIANNLRRDGPANALIGWFMRLHARCYNGLEFSEHDELESEVLSHLAIDLKERSLEGTLNKFILINVAAEYFAGERFKADPESPEILQSFYFFQRLNVKTMFTLLQVLQPEFEGLTRAETEDEDDVSPSTDLIQISVVARRVLPGLRHYSSWLTSNIAILIDQQSRDTPLSVQIKELWKIYASTLTLLASTFPVSALTAIDYLLEEDEDTLGFRPFENERTQGRYYQSGLAIQKPKWHINGVERQHPNLEMSGRIRDFLAEGLALAVDPTVPIDLLPGTTTFAYREDGMPSESQASPAIHQAKLSAGAVDGLELGAASPVCERLFEADEVSSQATSVSASMDTEAHRMVDDLLDSCVTENESNACGVAEHRRAILAPAFELSASGNRVNDTTYGFDTTLDASGFARALQDCSAPKRPQDSPRPHLPSIYNSPFAPQAGETTPPRSRPSTAKRMSPPHYRQQSQNASTLPPPQGMQSLETTYSSMPDSSNCFGSMQTPTARNPNAHLFPRNPQQPARNESFANYGAIGEPVLRAPWNANANGNGDGNGATGGFADDSEFRSSDVFVGSNWALTGQSANEVLNLHTPPNGQGGTAAATSSTS